MTPTTARLPVDVWVDPACPFAWMTSQWLFEVERQRPIDLRFHVMSLSVLNEDKTDVSDFYKELVPRAWGGVRVLIAGRQHDPSNLRALYVELARRIHHDKRPAGRDVYEEALVAAGYPRSLAGAADTDDLDELVRTSHHEGMDAVGLEVGTPVIHAPIDGDTVAFFGPVVIPPPRGEAAARLWDGYRMLLSVDGFYELKRSRDRDPQFNPVERWWATGQ